MNKYILSRPFSKIKRDLKIYIVIIMQLIGAFAILNIFLSLLLNIVDNKKNLMLESSNMIYQIEVQDTSFDAEAFSLFGREENDSEKEYVKPFPFREDIVKQITQQVPECEINVETIVELIYLGDYIDEDQVAFICYSSKYSNVQMNEKMRNILSDVSPETTVNTKDFPFQIKDDVLYDINQKAYPIEYTDNSEICVYLPIDLYYGIYHPKDLRNTVMSIQIKKSSFVDVVEEIMSVLHSQCGDEYQFKLGNEFASFLAKVNEAEKESKFLIFIAMIIFIIILIGMIGVFLMLLKRREREIAICCALGQTKKSVCLELFMEILILNMSSFLIGIVISVFLILKGIVVATVTIELSGYSVIILMAVAVVLSVVVIIPTKILVEKQSPIKILSSL